MLGLEVVDPELEDHRHASGLVLNRLRQDVAGILLAVVDQRRRDLVELLARIDADENVGRIADTDEDGRPVLEAVGLLLSRGRVSLERAAYASSISCWAGEIWRWSGGWNGAAPIFGNRNIFDNRKFVKGFLQHHFGASAQAP